MPGVTATPTAAAMAVPMRAATIPTTSVSQIGMFCLPGATNRPRAPRINPITNAVIIPVTSTEDLHQRRIYLSHTVPTDSGSNSQDAPERGIARRLQPAHDRAVAEQRIQTVREHRYESPFLREGHTHGG